MNGLGLIPDLRAHVDEDLRERPIRNLVGAPVARPPGVDYSPLLDVVPNQYGTSACGPFALATAAVVRSKLACCPIPRPAEKPLYDHARYVDAPGGPLLDVGVRMRALVDGAVLNGFVAGSRLPLTEGNVNDPPPLDVYTAGVGAELGGWYRTGYTGRAEEVADGLAKGFPFIYGQQVDAAYERLAAGEVYRGLSGRSRGGHAQAILGYFTLPDRSLVFKVAGSWGPEFADGGFALISEGFLNSDDVFDCIAITVTPKRIA